MPTQPEDRKPAKGEPFRFTDSTGVARTLPPASEAQQKLGGGDLEDAILGGEVGMAGLLIKALRVSGADAETLAALRAMPQGDYLATLRAWGEHGDGDGASLGE